MRNVVGTAHPTSGLLVLMVDRLLEMFRRHDGQWLSIETLQGLLGMDAVSIHSRIDQLRGMGYEIAANPIHGFCLAGTADRLSSGLLETGLGTRRIGRKVLVYSVTDSTNDVAWQHIDEVGYDGLAVFAEQQRGGRGRLGRRWDVPFGSSILCSVLLQNEGGMVSSELTLLVGLCVAEAVEEATGVATRIKWPNDVMVDGRKLAGTIVEARQSAAGQCFVIGMGINCGQQRDEFGAEYRERAISLHELTHGGVDRVRLGQVLLRTLDGWLADTGRDRAAELHERWLSRCDIVGRRLEVMNNGVRYAGRVIDVCCRQGLLLQLDDGMVKVFDGSTTSVCK